MKINSTSRWVLKNAEYEGKEKNFKLPKRKVCLFIKNNS